MPLAQLLIAVPDVLLECCTALRTLKLFLTLDISLRGSSLRAFRDMQRLGPHVPAGCIVDVEIDLFVKRRTAQAVIPDENETSASMSDVIRAIRSMAAMRDAVDVFAEGLPGVLALLAPRTVALTLQVRSDGPTTIDPDDALHYWSHRLRPRFHHLEELGVSLGSGFESS